MERRDSDHPVTCNFQTREDSQDPEQKLLLQTCQLKVSSRVNVFLFSTQELSERTAIFPTFIFWCLKVCIKIRNIPVTLLQITTNFNRSNILYDEASSWRSKRLKLDVMSLKKFVYICPENLLHFKHHLWLLFFFIYICPILGMDFLILQSKPWNIVNFVVCDKVMLMFWKFWPNSSIEINAMCPLEKKKKNYLEEEILWILLYGSNSFTFDTKIYLRKCTFLIYRKKNNLKLSYFSEGTDTLTMLSSKQIYPPQNHCKPLGGCQWQPQIFDHGQGDRMTLSHQSVCVRRVTEVQCQGHSVPLAFSTWLHHQKSLLFCIYVQAQWSFSKLHRGAWLLYHLFLYVNKSEP